MGKKKDIRADAACVPVYPLYIDLKALLLRRPPGAVLSRVPSAKGTWDLKDSPTAGDREVASSVFPAGTGKSPFCFIRCYLIFCTEYNIFFYLCQPLTSRFAPIFYTIRLKFLLFPIPIFAVLGYNQLKR